MNWLPYQFDETLVEFIRSGKQSSIAADQMRQYRNQEGGELGQNAISVENTDLSS